MKKIIVVFLFLFIACIPIKGTRHVKGFKIEKANTNNYVFVFKSNVKPFVFINLLKQRFNNAHNFTTYVNDQKFRFNVAYKQEHSQCINLFGFFLKNLEVHSIGEENYFFEISVLDSKGKSALNNNHLYYNSIIKYLNNLSIKYQSF